MSFNCVILQQSANSSRRQDRRLWQLLPPTYPTDFLHSSCYQCWCTTPSRLPTTATAAHPNKTAPFLWACGTDERLPRHFQSPTYVDPRAAQGLESRPGRPCHTWLRTLNADLHPLNHGLNSAWRLAQDRERWRQLEETATLQPGACSWWWWWWW